MVVSDTVLSIRVSAALVNDPRIDAMGVTVGVRDGFVTLEGRVATEDERMVAGEIARGIGGVAGVENLIQVDDTPGAPRLNFG